MKISPRQREALAEIGKGAFYPALKREPDGWYARWLGIGENIWIDYFVRRQLMTPSSRHAEKEDYPSLHDAWLAALKSETGRVIWNDAECEKFASELAEWSEPLLLKRTPFRFDSGDLSISAPVPHGREELKSLGLAAMVFPPLAALRKCDGRLKAVLSPGEAEVLVRTGTQALAQAGYTVEGIELKAPVEAEASISGREGREKLELVVRVGGEKTSAAEIEWMLEQNSTFVFFHGRWLEVDRNLLKQALRALRQVEGVKLSRIRALSFACGIGSIGKLELKDIALGGWLRGLVERLKRHGGIKLGASLEGFAGELREYQHRGVEWLEFMTANGFGALLADEMGLGKTVQTIAWLAGGRKKLGGAALIVAPITLLWNWRKEIERFAPKLKVYVHHGNSRRRSDGFLQAAAEADVVLTGYSRLVKDYSSFASVEWGAMVLDEAQAIKNAGTLSARAVCKLRPKRRIALTGTPIENSVEDIWSIENFLNPGFLGERREFDERFARPLKANPLAACGARLKRALEPFVLRRLKSDPKVAAEIGGKRETKEYCELLPEARAEYERALAGFRTSERKRGDIFALLTSLKLICDGEGKLQQLETLLDSIFASGESALVFTQYAKVAAAIAHRLEKRYGRRFPFMHGALPLKAREREIAAFNSGKRPDAFILSLKTGGFGLNLVKATHVIHFDRWWNPAVENQATDRAHRIGQRRTVMVHSLITAGTVEEHVDEILSRKRNLASIMSLEGEAFFKLVELS